VAARIERFALWSDQHPLLSRTLIVTIGWLYLFAIVGLFGPR